MIAHPRYADPADAEAGFVVCRFCVSTGTNPYHHGEVAVELRIMLVRSDGLTTMAAFGILLIAL